MPEAALGRVVVRARWATVAHVARYLGAAALVGVGIVHIWQYYVDYYSAIPTIGTLFILNFVSAIIVAAGLIAPLQRLGRGPGRALRVLLAASGAGIALGSLVGLEVSETSGLFGFMETGYRPAIVLSIVLDAATLVLLGAFLMVGRGEARSASTGETALEGFDGAPVRPIGCDACGGARRGGGVAGVAEQRVER